MRKHRYLKNDYQFFDALETKNRKIRENCNLLTKVKFHVLEWSSPLSIFFQLTTFVIGSFFSQNAFRKFCLMVESFLM